MRAVGGLTCRLLLVSTCRWAWSRCPLPAALSGDTAGSSGSPCALPRTREAIAALIVQFVESMTASAPCRRSAASAQRRASRRPRRGLPARQRQRDRLVAVYVPGVRDRQPGDRRACSVGRLPVMDGVRRRRAAVPALPAAVLRPDGGHRDVLQLLPVGEPRRWRRSRACSRSSRRCPSRPTRRRGAARGEVGSRACGSATPTAGAAALRPDDPRRADGRARRARPARASRPWPAGRALLRPDDRRGPARRRRPAGWPTPTCAARSSWSPRRLPVLRLGRRQHRLRPARHPRGDRGGGEGGRAHEFIAALPRRLTTPTCAKRGGRLSAGQRQLVASPARSSPTRRC